MQKKASCYETPTQSCLRPIIMLKQLYLRQIPLIGQPICISISH